MEEENDELEERSLDDVLEEERQKEEPRIEPLEEDNDSPAAPAESSSPIPKSHQLTDADIDAHELYDEGLSAAVSDLTDEERI